MLENATSDDVIKIIDHMKDIITPIGTEVYKIYYKQMIYTGIFETVIDLVILVGIPYMAYYIIKHKGKMSCFYEWVHNNDFEFESTVISAVFLILLGILFLATIDSFPSDIMHILNPDYYIIQNLLHG